jgi:dihydroxyacetone kinase-like protein
MPLDATTLRSLIVNVAERMIVTAPELCALDMAIGDGDHGTNMKRGLQAVLDKVDEIVALSTGEALRTIGVTLVATVGGASGPLYGSFFLAAGGAVESGRRLPEDLAEVVAAGVEAVRARGRSTIGEKTMLDVLVPVLVALQAEAGQPDLMRRIHTTAAEATERTAPLQATKGRAAYLGARSVGHVDPGARSSCLLVQVVCETLEARA